MSKINIELQKVSELLLLEKEEDLKQYQHKMASTSIVQRRKDGVCWYPVNIERTSYNAGERLLIRITRPIEHKEPHVFQSGKLVSLFSNNGTNSEAKSAISGVINRVKKNEMIITINGDNEPNWIRDGNIGVQLLFDENAYFEMMRALNIVINTEDDRLTKLKNILLSDSEAYFSDEYTNTQNHGELNKSQIEAINLVQKAQDIAIIHGPPGTGKTTTLVESIYQTLKYEKQALVCAPSNAAVDLLVEKLHNRELKVVRIGHPARVTDEILELTIDAKIANHTSYKTLRAVKKQSNECYNLAHKYKRNFGSEEREQRRLLLKESTKLKEEAKQLEYYIANDVLDKAQVIACTLVGASNYQIRDRKYNTVFIDEAGQGLEPATWIPITKVNRVIFAGDHFQLPPTVKCFEAAKKGLNETLFEKAFKRNNADIMLKEQYRMNKSIMQFSNQQFYNNKLKANESVENWSIFDEDSHVEFIDTAGCGFQEQSHKENKSSFNPEEANILLKHFNNYIETLETINHTEEITIGILSPYKAQVNYLQNIFEGINNLHPKLKVSINTIDSFQGQEKDIVYISLVRSNDKCEIGFLSDYRRMNVALTRAKKKMIIIGDSATIGNDKFYGNFIDYINDINAYRSAFEFLSL